MLSFDDKLQNYAQLGLIYGLGLDQKPRPLYVECYETEDHGGFLPVLAREAYRLGSETVDVHYRNSPLEREQFLGAPEGFKLYIPKHVSIRAKEIVERDGARIALNGNGDLGVMDDVGSSLPSAFKSEYFRANEPLTTRRMKMLQPWNILDVPSRAWAAKLGMSIEDLWEFLFSVTGADRDDAVQYAIGVSKTLHARSRLLNELGIRSLRFVGDGTDLKVGLSPKAQWLGGRKEAEDGTWFGPNWGSFEVYTTPDWRLTEGMVRVTMPTVLYGPIADGLSIWFENGRVSMFEAGQGTEAFKSLIEIDEGAAQLGEIALVGLDSPLSCYVEPHYCGMLDENKRCHMAVGQAYAAALKGGTTASKKELAALGCNQSDVHHDMMISDETTSVFALDADGKQLAQLMENGHWLPPFDCRP